MTGGNTEPVTGKISPQFHARLNRLKPGDKVRAQVLLHASDGAPLVRRPSRADRAAVLKAVRKAAEAALPELDEILSRFEGRRLAGAPDALGSIAIETTPDGIRALAQSEYIKGILEDQPLASLDRPTGRA